MVCVAHQQLIEHKTWNINPFLRKAKEKAGH